jgi:uncharacterized HAD superfamily protein
MRLGIDIDGVLADFNTAFYNRLIKVVGRNPFPANYQPTDPPCWEWPTAMGYTYEEEMATWADVWDDAYFWQHLNDEQDASETLQQIDKLSVIQGHEFYFITNRKGKFVKQQTERWLESRGIYYPTVLISGNKIPIINALKLDAFLDDRLDTVNEAQRCVDEGEILPCRIYLRDFSHNRANRKPGLRVVQSPLQMLQCQKLL